MHTPYAGFYDTFRSSVPVHLKGVQTLATKDSIGSEAQMSVFVDDKFYDSVMPGDHLFIVQEGHSALVKIDTKKPDHETLTFTSGTGFAIKQDAEIYRSHGNVMKDFAPNSGLWLYLPYSEYPSAWISLSGWYQRAGHGTSGRPSLLHYSREER